MKKFTSTFLLLFVCMYLSAQVGSLATTTWNASNGYVVSDIGTHDDYAQSVAVQSDGKIVVAGYVTNTGGSPNTDSLVVLRYKTDGTLDGSFGTNGIVKYQFGGSDTRGYAVGIQSTGQIVVAGWSWAGANKDFIVVRFNKLDGSVDNTFGISGATVTAVSSSNTDEAHAIAIQSNDNIAVAGFSNNGTNNDFALVHYTPNGAVDNTTFGSNAIVTLNITGRDEASGVAFQADGSVVVAGSSNMDASGDFAVARYTTAGTLDASNFGSPNGYVITDINTSLGNVGFSDDKANAMAIQSDGKIVLAGTFKPGGKTDAAVARYTSSGALDNTGLSAFGPKGIDTTNFASSFNSDDDVNALLIQGDGKILIAGSTESNPFDLMMIRYTSTGGYDAGFGTGGKATVDLPGTNRGNAVALSGNRIMVAGTSDANSATTGIDVLVAAFQNDFSTLPLTLTQFYAQKQTSKVLLQWQTSMEENVKQFVIERSNDGKTYTAIGQVTATGNSTTTKGYSYTDASPYMSASNYYRLVMQDIDGNYKYSKVLIIKFTGDLSTNVQVFPSPVKDILQIQLPGGLNGNVGLSIIDINGHIVKRNNIASDGNGLNTSFDVSGLPKGVYVLKAQAGNTIVTTRFAKL